MTSLPRPPSILHCTSEPGCFFGREQELRLLDAAASTSEISLVAFVGPGGQGKTAILQTWLQHLQQGATPPDGVFLWSFYRGKDADLCLRSLFAYAEGLSQPPEVAASYCVDHLLPILRRERWVLLLDGTEVVQHETGAWLGRFLHPELGRLLEELASAPLPGVVVLTSRFPLPTLELRRHYRQVLLTALDVSAAVQLLTSLGVFGTTAELQAAALTVGGHAKAVELLGTWLAHVHQGEAQKQRDLPDLLPDPTASPEEAAVARVLAAWSGALAAELADLVALATAFRQPPTQERLLDYLRSDSLRHLLHDTWKRQYPPFAGRSAVELTALLEQLLHFRLLERVSGGSGRSQVIDAHPLVRRGFENRLGATQQAAHTRAGFLRGRPDRRPPATLEEAQDEVELFHAYCDAGMWNEADSVFVALDNPKHRFLAPAFERALLLRFFPGGDWREKPLWAGFGRHRSLAICHELLGEFRAAIDIYPAADAALRGDAYLAAGWLEPLLDTPQMPAPWQSLWQAYRCHALCLRGRHAEALALVGTIVPVDIYEWVHVFECLLRLGQLEILDLRSMLYRPPQASEHRWSQLARQRMRLDHLRITQPAAAAACGSEYPALIGEYDRAGMPWERTLTRLSYGRWLLAQRQAQRAAEIAVEAFEITARHALRLLQADALRLAAATGIEVGEGIPVAQAERWKQDVGLVSERP